MATPIRKSGLAGLLLRKNIFFLLFFAYFLIATSGMLFASRGEYFPVFSWSLFTRVDRLSWTYEIEISRIDDEIYDPPVNFFELKDKFAWAKSRDTSIVKAAFNYHKALHSEPSRLVRLRGVIEGRFLSGYQRVDYTILHVQHDPLQRLRTGETVQRYVVAELSTADRP